MKIANDLIMDIMTYVVIGIAAFVLGFVLRNGKLIQCETDNYALFLKLQYCESVCK